ncbi:hypothetical protein [Butyrivibrio sp. AE2032]|uniref:hypothetical protein n=1 Tax=Butyrivibrio sp. AE2032 TaxID=1458463 RepID=UPI000554178E|nr:hypothetical protein [Butyrivibrio sp. AE2032]
MKYLNRYIPKEYLALKINYCRKQLEQLPKVKVHERRLNGSLKSRIIVDNHRYCPDTQTGKDFYEKMLLRNELERELDVYEAMWRYKYADPVPELIPENIVRTLYIDANTPVVMNSQYFDSLKNDANTGYSKPEYYQFNGTYYRSAAERSIAIFYTEMDIPFKYEPEVMLKGLRKPVYPDFVPYFKEIDSCKIHEHFGIMNSSDYIRDSKIKFGNLTNAGLLQDLDFMFTYSADDTLLDTRYLLSKLNSLIFGSMLCCVNRHPNL